MRILFVSQYFPPEMGAPAARVSEMARHWAAEGDDVTVLTAFAHHPLGVKEPRDRWRVTRRERFHGVSVLRAYIWATANKGVVRRMLSYFSFMVSGIVIGLIRARRPEIVVATSPQLLAACAGYVIARVWRVPFVFEVRDLWPESILAVNAMRENFVVRALKRLARILYERSDQIVTVGDGYRLEIHERYGVPLERMASIPNGIDPEVFKPAPRDGEVRRELGWGDRFVLLYLGTLGMAHGLQTVLDVANRLREDPDKLFVFVGEGAEKSHLVRMAAELELPNVQFLGYQARERVPGFYAACDVGLVALRNTPLFESVLPSKLFEIMAMAKPVLITVGGEARRVVESSASGVFVPPEDPVALTEAVCRLAEGEPDLQAMGKAGRNLVVRHYNRNLQAQAYRQLLGAVAKGARGPSSVARPRA